MSEKVFGNTALRYPQNSQIFYYPITLVRCHPRLHESGSYVLNHLLFLAVIHSKFVVNIHLL